MTRRSRSSRRRHSAPAVELLETLAPEQRDAIKAHHVEERGYAEIAAELRCSESVIRKRVSRGLAATASPTSKRRSLMSDPVSDLKRELLAAAERQQELTILAPKRRQGRRRWPLVAIAVAVVAGMAACSSRRRSVSVIAS